MTRRDHGRTKQTKQKQDTTTLGLSSTGARSVVGAIALTLAFGVAEPTKAFAATCGGAERNCVTEWNKNAEETLTVLLPPPRPFQNEGLLYMAYVAAAVYDAVVAIEGRYQPYGPGVTASAGASADAAAVEAAYRTLIAYFPGETARLTTLYEASLAAIPDGQPKTDGQAVGLAAANLIISLRANDGRVPVGTLVPSPTKAPGPGVWRLTPPFAPAQTPWVGDVRPFILQEADQFQPDAPPSLQSAEWGEAFDEVEHYGGITSDARTPERTATALFWTPATRMATPQRTRKRAGAPPREPLRIIPSTRPRMDRSRPRWPKYLVLFSGRPTASAWSFMVSTRRLEQWTPYGPTERQAPCGTKSSMLASGPAFTIASLAWRESCSGGRSRNTTCGRHSDH